MHQKWEFLAAVDTVLLPDERPRNQIVAVRELGRNPTGCTVCHTDCDYLAIYRTPTGKVVALCADCAKTEKLYTHLMMMQALPGARVLRKDRQQHRTAAHQIRSAWLAADPTRQDLIDWTETRTVMRVLAEMDTPDSVSSNLDERSFQRAAIAARKALDQDGYLALLVRVLHHDGKLNPHSEQALRDLRDQEQRMSVTDAHRALNQPPPVPVGLVTVTGTVLAVALSRGPSNQLRPHCLIESELGWRIWGPVRVQDKVAPGRTVQLTACLVRSPLDPTFGKYT